MITTTDINKEHGHTLIHPPTYKFNPGDTALYGNHTGTEILEKTEDSKFYRIRVNYEERDGPKTRETIIPWFELTPKQNDVDNLSKPDRLRYRTLNTDVDGLLSRADHFGVDFKPDYQRGLVWTPSQKDELLETIFDRGAIGTFSFNQRSYSTEEPLYEIVDGKQRLSTLIQFRQNQFSFKNRRYFELSKQDKLVFRQTPTLIYDLEAAKKEEVLLLFLRVNRRGTPVDIEHIKTVEKQLAELRKQKELAKQNTNQPQI